MKRLAYFALPAALATAVLTLFAPTGATAQVMIGAAGGVTFPTGDYGDYAKTGWLAHAGVSVPVGEMGVGVGVDGYFGINNHSDVDGDKTQLYGAAGSLSYVLGDPEGPAVPVIFGLIGSITHSYKSDSFPDLEGKSTSLAAGGGAGLGFPLGSVGGIIEAWWITGFSDNKDTKLFGVDLGVQFPVGGGM